MTLFRKVSAVPANQWLSALDKQACPPSEAEVGCALPRCRTNAWRGLRIGDKFKRRLAQSEVWSRVFNVFHFPKLLPSPILLDKKFLRMTLSFARYKIKMVK